MFIPSGRLFARSLGGSGGCGRLGGGGVLLKLTHIRPWVLPDPGGGGVGWICRSFHGQLIFKMGLWSGQREVSEKYWPVRRRSGNGYPPLPVVSSGYEGYALLGNQKHD